TKEHHSNHLTHQIIMDQSTTQHLQDQDLEQLSGGTFLGITPEMLLRNQRNHQLPRPVRPGENYDEIFKRIPR
ncbi:MAG: hypothetical protein ACO23C_07340, partial [Prochlorococcaceae cyanobacterium]